MTIIRNIKYRSEIGFKPGNLKPRIVHQFKNKYNT